MLKKQEELLVIWVNIMNRDYILDEYNNTIVIHKVDDFKKMRKAGNLASKVLDYIEPYIKELISYNKYPNYKKRLFKI